VEYKQAIDDWRSGERDKPSRSEAIRWLIGQGLQVESNKGRKQR
jgi:metal-responsive CopG/Arc/MetJ family transcriptional regulator